jgi:hypothetical protein
MFSGTTLSPTVEALVRAFYNPAGTRAASRTSIAQTLRDYSRLSQEQGADLLGTGGAKDPAAILNDLNAARSRSDQSQGTLTPVQPPVPAPPPPLLHPPPPYSPPRRPLRPAPVAAWRRRLLRDHQRAEVHQHRIKTGQLQHRINGKLTNAGDWHRALDRGAERHASHAQAEGGCQAQARPGAGASPRPSRGSSLATPTRSPRSRRTRRRPRTRPRWTGSWRAARTGSSTWRSSARTRA